MIEEKCGKLNSTNQEDKKFMDEYNKCAIKLEKQYFPLYNEEEIINYTNCIYETFNLKI